MDKPWLNSYPPDMPATIDADAYPSLVHLINQSCTEFADNIAFSNFGSRLHFSELDKAATAFATYLQQTLGLKRGERVALMMPNMLAYPVTLLGALRAGAVVVNVNPQYTERELSHVIEDSGARALVIFEAALAVSASVEASHPALALIVARIGDFMIWPKAMLFNSMARRRAEITVTVPERALSLEQALDAGRKQTFEPVDLCGQDLAFLQYTGGTTGRSKGAMLTHRNIIANLMQINAWFGPKVERGKEIIITALPLYHIYALTGNCFAFMAHGSQNYLISDPRNIRTFVKEMKRVKFTAISGVNTLFNALVQNKAFHELDFSALKFTSGGGMAVQGAVAEQWQRVTGLPIGEGYGLTEASPVVTSNRIDATEFTGSIGLPVPSTEVKIVDDNGTELALNEAGEMWVRGPQVMCGYWNNTEETAAVLSADGWLKTGDIARMDEQGYCYIVDRKKDMVVVSGFNVYPNEIEEVLVQHPDVNEAAAIGVKDEKSGEAVRAVVVSHSDTPDGDAIIAWCRENLAAYKIPRSIVFADALPKSNVGKILRREVREIYGE